MQAMLSRPPLEIGGIIVLGLLGSAGILGVIAVLDAGSASTSLATGLGIAALVFLAGGTIACGLACLRRGRATVGALLGVLSACLAINLFVLEIWLEIDSETYGKIAGLTLVWSFFALIALALTIAVGPVGRLALLLYRAALAAIILAGLLSSWLVATAGGTATLRDVGGLGVAPVSSDDSDLRALGVSLVVVAVLWFAALAADRGTRPQPGET